MKLKICILPLLLAGSVLRLAAASLDVKSFGAAGDGKTVDTRAINRAIDAAASAGGGTVDFPAGRYLTYSIHLRSHVALHLDAGSVIVAAEPPADLATGFDPPEPNPAAEPYADFGHVHWHNSLIWGENLEDIGITGPGMIFGRGLSRGRPNLRRDLLPEERNLAVPPTFPFPAAFHAKLAALKPGPFGYPSDDTLPAGVGNKAIALKNCRNVIFRDFTISHGGHFGILATGVDNWTCDNLKIDTNRDGIDLDCCRNVRVANCTVNSPFDDGICPKSSYALGANRPTENITITNCQVSGFDEGTLLDGTLQRHADPKRGPTGRIKCGTESNGGFRNVTISNCTFEYCRGLALESVDGSLMEDIAVSNLAMRDIVNSPIFIRLGRRLRGPAGALVGTARRIKIDNVVAHNVAADGGILIVGAPERSVEDVSLSHIFIDYQGGGTAQDGKREVPEDEIHRYPEPSGFGSRPSWGLFARRVSNLAVDHVEFRAAEADLRPVAWVEDVAGAAFDHVVFPHAPGAPTFVLKQDQGLVVRDAAGLADTVRAGEIGDEKL